MKNRHGCSVWMLLKYKGPKLFSLLDFEKDLRAPSPKNGKS